MSQRFVSGQRWISIPEPDLGLGLVVEAEHRRVTLSFPAASEERSYAADSAPLSRVQFAVGDSINVADEVLLTVVEVQEHQGCLVYITEDENQQRHPIPEQLLSPDIPLHNARDRLLAGQLDDPRRFELRAATLEYHNRAKAGRSRGLLGPRVALIPHQFYIARSAAAHDQPRLLLADEVGLGKTIEAGLILHQLYLDERIRRVLVLVPESLIHQWLVEMRRRFNLNFSIFDESRCSESLIIDIDEEDPAETGPDSEDNPFEDEQLIIASVDWLANSPLRQQQLLAAGWDMLIVDEAHHLQWREDGDSSASYQLVEELCGQTPSVLLLTATPENTGIEGHFARLRLLDPDRYASLAAFREEQTSYTLISELIEQLSEDPVATLTHTDNAQQLAELLDESLMARLADAPQEGANEAIEALLDRFGTGRSLFRNSRNAVGGFPARRLFEHPLPAPEAWDSQASSLSLEAQLHPEGLLGDDWLREDPRVSWLENFLLKNLEARVLLICASADTAQTLEQFLRLRRGIASAVFHENMSLLERDRAAAYFADNDDGAQLLVCSEIGSEGRNFQFAEHLVLFDLPLDPDLLEQRIGRLDRIGRQGEVAIHVPFYQHTAQQGLLHWYRDALAIFSEPCTIGSALLQAFDARLRAALLEGGETLNELVAEAATQAEQLRAELHSGRNRLLELNSCRPAQAQALVTALEEEQRGDELASYLEQVAQQFGLEHEDHSEQAIVLHPGDHMLIEAFPQLPPEGLTGTFDRQRALEREDMAFLTWEHPLIREAMDLIVTGDFGSACVCTLPVKGLPDGSLLLESFLNPVIHAPAVLQLDRYLPAYSDRLLIDHQGRRLHDKVSHAQLNTLCQKVKRKLIAPLLREVREPLTVLLNHIEAEASQREARWREQASAAYTTARSAERTRLQALAARNPNVGDIDLTQFDAVTEKGLAALGRLQLISGALRLAIVSG